MATDFERQSWQREMLNFKGVKSLFILEGNVNDKYPDVVDGGLQFSELAEVVRGLFEDANGSVEYNVAYFDPIQLFSSSMGNVDCKRLVSLAHDEASKNDDRMMERTPASPMVAKHMPPSNRACLHTARLSALCCALNTTTTPMAAPRPSRFV